MSEPLSQRTPVQLGLLVVAAGAIWLAAADHWKLADLERRMDRQESLNLAVKLQQIEDQQTQVNKTLREVVLVLREVAPVGARRRLAVTAEVGAP